jgi:membrane protein YqaA with SNARE-associated domain
MGSNRVEPHPTGKPATRACAPATPAPTPCLARALAALLPGTVSLSLLSGALYGTTRGLALVAAVSTLGSTACYCMSWVFGRPVAIAIWRGKLQHFADEVRARDNDLLSYIIFLRVTPILPNTFINVASPIVGVPLAPFFFGGRAAGGPARLWGGGGGAHPSPAVGALRCRRCLSSRSISKGSAAAAPA